MKERGESSNKLSIIERIDSATKQRSRILQATPREFEAEISRLATQGDAQSLSHLFDAYCAWEVVSKKKRQSIDKVRRIALQNFDDIARVADARTVARSDIAIVMAKVSYPSVGRIQQFFRDTVNYHPVPPARPRKAT